jgi:hypothetical protein
LNSKIQTSIKWLTEQILGYTDLKRKVFEEFKVLGYKHAERNRITKNVTTHMQNWKVFMCFKSWQNLKVFEAKQEEKEQKALELLTNRRLFRLFNNFKIGIVYSRISYLDYQIIDIVHTNNMKLKVLIEWCRRAHVDKSIKEKVLQMLNKSQPDMNKSFLSMNKLQIEDYFNGIKSDGLQRISENLVTLKLERSHYKTFIKNETQLFEREIDTKYPLKLDLKTQTFFDVSYHRPKVVDAYFTSSRQNFTLTPEKLRNKNAVIKLPPNGFVDLLKSHNSNKSFDKLYVDAVQPYTDDVHKSLLEKEMIHRSFHNYKSRSCRSS